MPFGSHQVEQGSAIVLVERHSEGALPQSGVAPLQLANCKGATPDWGSAPSE